MWNGSRWNESRFNGAPILALPPDLMAAVVAQMRSSWLLITALAENTSVPGMTKIWADDLAFDQPQLPYLTYAETSQDIQGTTGTIYVATGIFTISVVHLNKTLCRQLGVLVMAVLDNSQLLITNGNVRYLRHNDQKFQTIPAVGAGSPVTYKMTIDFDYMLAMNFSF